MTIDETTGTQGQEGGDAGDDTQTAGTPGADGRDASHKGDDLSKLNLEWKGKAEKLNAMLAKSGAASIEELEERLSQSPAAPAQTSDETDGDDDEAEMRAVEAFAAKGDPVAKALLKERKRREQLTRGVGDALTARDIQDPDERKQALTHYERNRHRLGDVSAALAEVRAVKLSKENARLQEELKKLQKGPDPDVVKAPSTGGREISAGEVKARKMTGSQFDAEVARLHAEGKSRSALDLQRAYADGKITLTG